MIWDILFVAVISIPAVFVAILYALFIGNNAKKGTALVLVLIEFPLLAILQFKLLLPFCIDFLNHEELCIGRTWTYIINVIILILLCFGSYAIIGGNAVICPHCGAWNDYTDNEILRTSSYKRLETVDRKIKDNYGQTIGTYEDKELKTYYTVKYRCKCGQCGKTFEYFG